MAGASEPVGETMGLLIDKFEHPFLSGAAKNFVRNIPREARVAVAAALKLPRPSGDWRTWRTCRNGCGLSWSDGPVEMEFLAFPRLRNGCS